jgi:hypothetical protein
MLKTFCDPCIFGLLGFPVYLSNSQDMSIFTQLPRRRSCQAVIVVSQFSSNFNKNMNVIHRESTEKNGSYETVEHKTSKKKIVSGPQNFVKTKLKLFSPYLKYLIFCPPRTLAHNLSLNDVSAAAWKTYKFTVRCRRIASHCILRDDIQRASSIAVLPIASPLKNPNQIKLAPKGYEM